MITNSSNIMLIPNQYPPLANTIAAAIMKSIATIMVLMIVVVLIGLFVL